MTEPASRTPQPPRPWLNRTVLGAGLTSAFGDFSYETTNVILPGFLAVLGIPASVLGTVEGIADAVASFTKLGAGYISDRVGHRKALVVMGYGLTPLGQACIALAFGWPMILLGRGLSWFGKGIRAPLRDAIVSESITPETRGRAFGFHRALDTVGAVLGPLLGIALLAWVQKFETGNPARAFRIVIWATLVPGSLSMLCFAVLVQDDRSTPNARLRLFAAFRGFSPRFRQYLAAIGVFASGDFSHAMLILAATQILTPEWGVIRAAQIAGGLYVTRNVVQVFASYPIGAAADRLGHRRALVCGYVLGTVTAGLMGSAFLLHWNSIAALGAIFLVAGLYVAVQEALEPALAADFVGPESRGVGYGALGAVNGVGKLISSTAVGFLWTEVSPAVAFGAAAAIMLVGTIAMIRVGRSQPER